MLALVLALALAQVPPPLAKRPPALSLLPGGAGAKSGLPITGSGECSVNGVAGSYGEAVTFTRATAWSCTRSDGSMVWLDAGVPALTGGAVKVRPQTINNALWSEALDTAATWVPLGAIGDGGTAASMQPAVTANSADVTDPMGGTTSEKVVFPATVWAGDATALQQSITGTAAAWSAGIYLRTLSGTATVYLYDYTGSSAPPANALATCAVTSTWGRCKWENATLSVAAYKLSLGVDLRATIGTGQVARAGSTVYVWGAQAQTGAALGDLCSPVLATAVTCNAETVAMSNPLAGVNPSAWCIEGRVPTTPAGNSAKYVGSIGVAAAANSAYLGDQHFGAYDSTGTQKYVTWATGVSGLIRACDNSGTLTVTQEGALISGAASGAGTGIITTQPSVVYVGNRSDGLKAIGTGISDFAIINQSMPIPAFLSFLPPGDPQLALGAECSGAQLTASDGMGGTVPITTTRTNNALCYPTDGGAAITLTANQPNTNANGMLVEGAATDGGTQGATTATVAKPATLSDAEGCVSFTMKVPGSIPASADYLVLMGSAAATGAVYFNGGPTAVTLYDGTSAATWSGASLVGTAPSVRGWWSVSRGKHAIVVNGSEVQANYDGAMLGPGPFYLGSQQTGAGQSAITLRNLRFGSSSYGCQ